MDTFSDFQREIAHAARASFEDLRSARLGEHFYAYALYTDSSAMTVMPAANSIEALMQIRKEMDIPDDEEAPEFKWSVSEWKYEAWKASNLNGISAKLRSELEHADFPSFVERVHGDMVAALQLLDNEGYFGTGPDREQIVLFVSISDDDDAVRLENESAKVLNPAVVYEEFLRRYD
jgi:hypothetical protein